MLSGQVRYPPCATSHRQFIFKNVRAGSRKHHHHHHQQQQQRHDECKKKWANARTKYKKALDSCSKTGLGPEDVVQIKNDFHLWDEHEKAFIDDGAIKINYNYNKNYNCSINKHRN